MGNGIPRWNVIGSTISSSREKFLATLDFNTFFFVFDWHVFLFASYFSFYIPKAFEQ